MRCAGRVRQVGETAAVPSTVGAGHAAYPGVDPFSGVRYPDSSVSKLKPFGEGIERQLETRVYELVQGLPRQRGASSFIQAVFS